MKGSNEGLLGGRGFCLRNQDENVLGLFLLLYPLSYVYRLTQSLLLGSTTHLDVTTRSFKFYILR